VPEFAPFDPEKFAAGPQAAKKMAKKNIFKISSFLRWLKSATSLSIQLSKILS
jgi:hypothetical protein